MPAILENEGYGTWDLRGSYRVARQLSITGAIDNLADSNHMEPLGYPVLGRAVRLGIRTTF